MRALACLVSMLALSGCSILVANELDSKDDPPGTDGGPGVDGGPGTDAGPGTDGGGGEVDCTRENNGTSCGTGLICISMTCVSSECGDGFADMVSGEECDDGNDESGDGCEPLSCTFTCSDDPACDDANPCNGSEMCDATEHTCAAGTAEPDGTVCVMTDGTDGVCRSELCVAPGCGDGTAMGTEECDDGMNGDPSDGCRDDCTFTCREDADCDDGDACNGVETCDTTEHVCNDPADVDCNDSSPCTTDSCDPTSGCLNVLMDADGDGSAPDTLGTCGTDCDDADASRYEGATEFCDSIDNDCDGTVDDMPAMATCYRDADADGFGDMRATMSACTCPAGWLPARRDGLFDCADGSSPSSPLAQVYPGQTAYFSSPYCPTALCTRTSESYDYNCDGVETRRYNVGDVTTCSSIREGCSASGWRSRTIPDCGVDADYSTCVGTTFCTLRTITVRQQCR